MYERYVPLALIMGVSVAAGVGTEPARAGDGAPTQPDLLHVAFRGTRRERPESATLETPGR